MTALPADTQEPAQPGRPPLNRRFADLGPRLVSGVVLVALALGTAIAGGQAFALLWWVAALAIVWEWQRMIGGSRVAARFLLGGIALSLAAPLAQALLLQQACLVLLAGALLVSLLAGPGRHLWAGCGVLYAGALVLSVDLLRQSFPFGVEAILWLFAVVWGTDIMAYAGGRLVGGPKLMPRFSPSKTWAGFLIGIAFGSLAGLAVAPAPGPYGTYLVLGLAIGAVAQAGDLFESAVKRRFGVKDSSRLIPGHGGVMDRLDGFLVAASVAALIGVVRFGVETPGAGLFRW